VNFHDKYVVKKPKSFYMGFFFRYKILGKKLYLGVIGGILNENQIIKMAIGFG